MAVFFVMKLLDIHAYPEKDPYVIIRSEKPREIPVIEDLEPISEQDSGRELVVDSTVLEDPDVDSLQNSKTIESEEASMSPGAEAQENATGYFDQLVEDYRDEILSQLPEKKNRTDIVVRYYNHEADQNRAEILQQYGFYLHKRPVDEQLSQYPSNTIYYGDDVSTRDIHLIAYLLLQNGMDIKAIQLSKYHDSWKSRAVEIGTDIDLTDEPNLTLAEIMKFDK